MVYPIVFEPLIWAQGNKDFYKCTRLRSVWWCNTAIAVEPKWIVTIIHCERAAISTGSIPITLEGVAYMHG